jgi:DNA-binding transcriptional MerR regulator
LNTYTRKDLSELFNIGKETLRYYENINLIPNPTRNESGYRVYSEDDVVRIKFIVRLIELLKTVKDVKAVLHVN